MYYTKHWDFLANAAVVLFYCCHSDYLYQMYLGKPLSVFHSFNQTDLLHSAVGKVSLLGNKNDICWTEPLLQACIVLYSALQKIIIKPQDEQ